MHAEALPDPVNQLYIAAEPGQPEVRVTRNGGVLRLTLNRDKAINALSHHMVGDLQRALDAALSADPPTTILLDGVGERGFCCGGDVKELAAGTPTEQLSFFGDEYRLDAALNESSVPVVSVMHGIAMGGGIGIGGHTAVRIVTESSKLGMPEVRIGIVPDVGGSLLLARAPGRLGELLAMTAGVMSPGDAVALGFADYFVLAERLPVLRAALAAGEPVADAVASVAGQAPESKLMQSRSWWDHLAEDVLGDPTEVLRAPATTARQLITVMEQSPHREARDAAMVAQQMSPFALAVAIAQISRVRSEGLDLRAVLADDYRLLGRLLARPDFSEGVRAQLIDRDGAPKWQPHHLEEVTDAEVRAILDPVLRPGEVAWQSTR